MSGVGKDQLQFSPQIKRLYGEFIEARAGDLRDVKPTRYVAYIIEWWFSKGCPAVTVEEEALEERGLLRKWRGGSPAKKGREEDTDMGKEKISDAHRAHKH